mmetsp:Transcript_17998/g.42045  ORF Transcript_17998/g.42045 Transcript_17998/m.42045 type:complete len:609 (-) Transcript_17998:72-1898(-)
MAKPSPPESALAGGDGKEVQQKTSDVFSDIAVRLQLLSIGCSEWLKRKTCCCCLPLASLGGYLLCGWVLLRGLIRLNEVLGPVHLLFEYSTKSPLALVARFLVVVIGFGDVMVGLLGLYGIVRQKIPAVAVFFCWMCLSLLLTLLTLPLAISFDTTYYGHWVAILTALLEIAFDVYLLFVATELLLLVTYKGKVSDAVDQVLCNARALAVERGDGEVQKADIAASLVEDDSAQELLRASGVNIAQLSASSVQPWGGNGTFSAPSRLSVRFSLGAQDLIVAAVAQQQEIGQPKLVVADLVIALCGNGKVDVGTMQSVDMTALRQKIDDMRREETLREAYPGPPPVRFMNALPAEEMCLVLLVFQLLFSIVSLWCFIVYGMGIVQRILRLRTLPSMWWLEFLVQVANVAFCCMGLSAIFKNQQGRKAVRARAYEIGVRWGAELGECFAAVMNETIADTWLSKLSTSSRMLFTVLLWNAVQFFLEVLIYIMMLLIGDTCGFYMHGLMAIAQMGPNALEARVDCSRYDTMAMGATLCLLGFRIAFAYALLVLWHEYGFGWTTTDAGLGILVPSNRLPEALVRSVAGLPPPWAKGIEGAMSKSRLTEATPLLK